MPCATFYVQIEPVYGYRYGSEDPPVRGAKAVAVSQKKPPRPRANAIVVKLSVDLPTQAFTPLAPEAVITIPASLIQGPAIEVTAEDPVS